MKKEEELSEDLRKVALEGGTEEPFTGKYWDNHEEGIFKCAICATELFSSDTKFDSGTGWPSFTEPANLEHVELKEDTSYGMKRTEVNCKNCGAHLGHVAGDAAVVADQLAAIGRGVGEVRVVDDLPDRLAARR